MRLNTLSLTNFRTYSHLECEFREGATTFIGSNGAGKTNIIESLIYLSYLSSHRVSTNQPLIKTGEDQAVIRAEIFNADRKLTVDLEINATKTNRAQLNGNPCRSQKEILGALQTIYFSPEDLDLVRGEPTGRRDFLDRLLITRNPRMVGVLSDYDRVVRQRNTLLRSRAATGALEPWTEQLLRLGAEIISSRLNLISQLAPHVATHYATLNKESPAEISYKSSTDGLSTNIDETSSALESKYRAVANQEMERGVSLVGPHRDDLHLQLGEFPAKGYASHGESWSFALSLKLGSLNLLRADGSTPILILDDVFAELDTARRQHLISATQIAEQTFITAAVEGDLPTDLLVDKFYVTPGEVRHG